MTPDLLTILILLASWLAVSIIVAKTPHPSTVDDALSRFLLSILGRLSGLRHGATGGDSPGTLHWPGTAQPPPRPPALYVRGELDEVPTGPQPRATVGPTAVALALLLPLAMAACTLLTPPRQATAVALKGAKDRAGKFKAWAATEEQMIADTSKTREEARARLDAFRKGVDYCAEEIIRPGLGELRQVGKALDADPEPGAAAARPPDAAAAPDGGAR